MVGNTRDHDGAGASRWRLAAWGSAVALVLLPLVAMQVSAEVNWGPEDFVLAIILVGSVGLAFELAVRTTRNLAYRAGAGAALAGAFGLVWINLAVGIVGSEDNPDNLFFFAVPVVALLGSVIARFRAQGMARALLAAAVAHVAVSLLVLAANLGSPASEPAEILGVTAFLAAPWLLSAWLFRRAAREMAGAAPAA